jgi:hypothetical protein
MRLERRTAFGFSLSLRRKKRGRLVRQRVATVMPLAPNEEWVLNCQTAVPSALIAGNFQHTGFRGNLGQRYSA